MKSTYLFAFLIFFQCYFNNILTAQSKSSFTYGVYAASHLGLSDVGLFSKNTPKSANTHQAIGAFFSYRFPKSGLSLCLEPGYLKHDGFSGISTKKEQKVYGLGENKRVHALHLTGTRFIQAPISIQWANRDIGIEFGANPSYLIGARGKLTSQLVILNPTVNPTTVGLSMGDEVEKTISTGWIDTQEFALRQTVIHYFVGAKFLYNKKLSIGYRIYSNATGQLYVPISGALGKNYSEWRIQFAI